MYLIVTFSVLQLLFFSSSSVLIDDFCWINPRHFALGMNDFRDMMCV